MKYYVEAQKPLVGLLAKAFANIIAEMEESLDPKSADIIFVEKTDPKEVAKAEKFFVHADETVQSLKRRERNVFGLGMRRIRRGPYKMAPILKVKYENWKKSQ